MSLHYSGPDTGSHNGTAANELSALFLLLVSTTESRFPMDFVFISRVACLVALSYIPVLASSFQQASPLKPCRNPTFPTTRLDEKLMQKMMYAEGCKIVCRERGEYTSLEIKYGSPAHVMWKDHYSVVAKNLTCLTILIHYFRYHRSRTTLCQPWQQCR